MSTPADLADLLDGVDEHEYVRFTAHWLTGSEDLDTEPPLTGDDVVDALVAAAAALAGYRRHGHEPEWTTHTSRALNRFWHPGNPKLFAYALVHAPASFTVRGILIEEKSLTSI